MATTKTKDVAPDPLADVRADLAATSARASELSAEVERWKRETKKGQKAVDEADEKDAKIKALEATVKERDSQIKSLEAQLASAQQASGLYEGKATKLDLIKDALA